MDRAMYGVFYGSSTAFLTAFSWDFIGVLVGYW